MHKNYLTLLLFRQLKEISGRQRKFAAIWFFIACTMCLLKRSYQERRLGLLGGRAIAPPHLRDIAAPNLQTSYFKYIYNITPKNLK